MWGYLGSERPMIIAALSPRVHALLLGYVMGLNQLVVAICPLITYNELVSSVSRGYGCVTSASVTTYIADLARDLATVSPVKF